MANEIVYLKIAQMTEVHKTDVYLRDIAEIYCQDRSIEAKAKTIKVASFHARGKKESNPYIGSVMELVGRLEEIGKNIEINNIGQTDFVISYKPNAKPILIFEWLKTVFISVIAFFGAAFAIMTFNNDVNVPDVFNKLYNLAMGAEAEGLTILECSYSLGITLGILVFFNHFAKWKLTVDPTPIEVEMRLYEENLNKTIIQNHSRKESGIDVS
ncbi:MAG: stage V sporulation protein AA [Lachnospiraceae bacterium]|nr:stage V sporulation protein AA [Lachnospiraceae bacterium]